MLFYWPICYLYNVLHAQPSSICSFSLDVQQTGFIKYYSTINHLHTINQLIKKSYEYQQELHLAFIDYTKAFDSLNHNFMLKAPETGHPRTLRANHPKII